MKIGFTERGDAGRDLSWYNKIDQCDGLILITKSITNAFIEQTMKALEEKPIVLHCTITGFGGSAIEPHVPKPSVQLTMLDKLIKKGFPVKNVVLRIDPIIPTEKGLRRVKAVLDTVTKHPILNQIRRVRFSILDEYKHVKERMREAFNTTIYQANNFSASVSQMKAVYKLLSRYETISFESCAEVNFHSMKEVKENVQFYRSGCISTTDLKLMGLSTDNINKSNINSQNRFGCLCLSIKHELLERKHPCKNGCLYCYWK